MDMVKINSVKQGLSLDLTRGKDFKTNRDVENAKRYLRKCKKAVVEACKTPAALNDASDTAFATQRKCQDAFLKADRSDFLVLKSKNPGKFDLCNPAISGVLGKKAKVSGAGASAPVAGVRPVPATKLGQRAHFWGVSLAGVYTFDGGIDSDKPDLGEGSDYFEFNQSEFKYGAAIHGTYRYQLENSGLYMYAKAGWQGERADEITDSQGVKVDILDENGDVMLNGNTHWKHYLHAGGGAGYLFADSASIYAGATAGNRYETFFSNDLRGGVDENRFAMTAEIGAKYHLKADLGVFNSPSLFISYSMPIFKGENSGEVGTWSGRGHYSYNATDSVSIGIELGNQSFDK